MATSPARRRPPTNRGPTYSRDSNTLRASVLDVALELGIGTSRTVENWMFNALEEEDEEDHETVVSPGLTSGSTATSEESSLSAFLQRHNESPIASQLPSLHIHALSEESYASRTLPQSNAPSPVSAPPIPMQKQNKLRKSRKEGGDSDGGYLSDSGKKKGSKKASKGDETEYETDGELAKDKKKSKKKDKKGSAKDDAAGYTTDGSTKSSKKSSKKAPSTPDGGEVSDGGYISEVSVAKKKKSFFRMPSKSSSLKKSTSTPNLTADVQIIPPVPALPPMPLPIADRFARSVDEGSRSTTPVPPASSPAPYAPVPRPTPPPASAPPGWPVERTSSSSVLPEEPIDALMHTLRDRSPPESANASEPASTGRRQGVRFTPSTRFSPSDDRPFIVPPSPQSAHPIRPTISLPITSMNMPSPPRTASPSSANSQPFLARSLQPRKIPSPLSLNPPPLLGISPSPVPSDYSVISSSEFIVPSPSRAHGLSPLPSPHSRTHFLDMPPPTPPPQGPLPKIPFPPESGLLPTSTSRGPSSAPGSSPGLFSQPIPSIQRGRELPFPARPLLPAAESSSLVQRVRSQRTMRSEEEWDPNARSVEPRFARYVVHDADDVRSDVAQFFFAPEDTARTPRGIPAYAEEEEEEDEAYDAYADDRSVYPESEAHTQETHRSRLDVESEWQTAAGQRASMWSSRASFIDDERSHEMRTRFIERVDAMYGEEEEVPPVPPLRF